MQWIARVTRTHFIIAFAGLIAFISTFAFLQSLDKKTRVARLTHDVNAGSKIARDDVSFVEVSYDPLVASNLFSESEIKNKTYIARVDLTKSDLLMKSNTSRLSTSEGLQSMSLGLSIERANGGDINKGDLVDIWRTGDESRLIAQSIEVRSALAPSKRLGISTAKSLTLVLAVTPKQAQDLSEVVGSSDIMAVISNGSTGKYKPAIDSKSDYESNGESFEQLTSEIPIETSEKK